MKDLIINMLKDKAGNYSMREVIILVSMLLIILSWAAQLIFKIPTPEYMFYSIVSMIATGCFGYSIERKPPTENN